MDKENKKARCTNKQIKALVNYMLENPLFANGEFKGPLGKSKMKREWEQVTTLLNELGPSKTAEAWQRTWRELKKKARAENAVNRKALNATGNNQVVIPVSEISKLVISVIGDDSSIGIGPEESTIGTMEGSQPNYPTHYTSSITSQACSSSDLTTYSPPTHDPLLAASAASSPTHAPAPTSVHAPAPAHARSPAPRAPQDPASAGGAQRPIRRSIRAHTNAEHFKNLHVSQNDIMKELVDELKQSNSLKKQLLLEQKEHNGLLRDMIKEIKTRNNTGCSSQTESESIEASPSEMQVEGQAAVANPLSSEPDDADSSQVIAPRVLPLMKPIRLSTKQIKCGKIEVMKLKDGTVVLQKKKDV